MTPSLYLLSILFMGKKPQTKNRDGVMYSFVCLSCVMTPCFFLFHVLSHPYIRLHFEEMIFPLVLSTTVLSDIKEKWEWLWDWGIDFYPLYYFPVLFFLLNFSFYYFSVGFWAFYPFVLLIYYLPMVLDPLFLAFHLSLQFLRQCISP